MEQSYPHLLIDIEAKYHQEVLLGNSRQPLHDLTPPTPLAGTLATMLVALAHWLAPARVHALQRSV